jgi:outer membrane lipoprotein-sorting protein
MRINMTQKRFCGVGNLERVLGILLVVLVPAAVEAAPAAKKIIQNTLSTNHWGFSDAKVQASAVLLDRRGRKSTLVFNGISRRWKSFLTKSLVRFSKPPDLAGAGFLQIEQDKRDDDRFIYLPALKRHRRVAGSQRSNAFMGTDFNFADLDRRDWRTGRAKLGKDTKIGKFPCYHVTITPTRRDSPYSRIEIDVRKDNWVPLKIQLFDKAKVLYKVLEVFQLRRIKGRWFISKSRMNNLRDKHTTTLYLKKIEPKDDIPDSSFTIQRLKRQ